MHKLRKNVPGGHKVESVNEGNKNNINRQRTHTTYIATSVILLATIFFTEYKPSPALFLALICKKRRMQNELSQKF